MKDRSPLSTPFLGPPVRRISKIVPVLARDNTHLYDSTLVIDTYGDEDHEQVVCDWPMLESLIDQLIAYRLLVEKPSV